MKLHVVGLDGSLQNFGIAVGLVDTETWTLENVVHLELSQTKKSTDKKVKRSDDDFDRFRQHFGAIKNVMEDNNASYVFGEIPSGAQDARAAFAFGGVTAILAALSIDIDTVVVTPTQVKVAATGMKHADKEDVIEAMHRLYPDADWITSSRPNAMAIQTVEGAYLTNANEHLADAIGVILAGLQKMKDSTNQ